MVKAKMLPPEPNVLSKQFKIERANRQFLSAEPVQSKNPNIDLTINDGGTDYHYAVFSKTLPHNVYGEVSSEDFSKLYKALETGKQEDFDNINRHPSAVRKLVDPQGSMAYALVAQDPMCVNMPHFPSITSEQAASELMEVYEMAMHRDIPFDTIAQGSDSNTVRAIYTLNNYGMNFKGPNAGFITGKQLFRGSGGDETVGPYVSQMLYLPFNYGNIEIEQLIKEESDQANSTSVAGWLDIQNGIQVGSPNFTGQSRYIHTPRILGSYVHNDPGYQAYYNAALIMLQNGVPFDVNIPNKANEHNFVSYGPPDVFSALGTVLKLALNSAWNQKWLVNLALRPEVMAGRVHFEDTGARSYGIDPSGHGANTIAAIKSYNNTTFGNNTALLPLQFPEGSPTHPSYPAGHSTVAGACTTILKAFFDTTKTWVGDLGLTPKHSIDGISLVNYTDVDASGMTVLGELNKLASNIATGRNMAGVHYRCDGDKGIVFGEKIAIAFLQDLKHTYNEDFDGWTLTKFDGTTITI